jgi:hypothetical protein
MCAVIIIGIAIVLEIAISCWSALQLINAPAAALMFLQWLLYSIASIIPSAILVLLSYRILNKSSPSPFIKSLWYALFCVWIVLTALSLWGLKASADTSINALGRWVDKLPKFAF